MDLILKSFLSRKLCLSLPSSRVEIQSVLGQVLLIDVHFSIKMLQLVRTHSTISVNKCLAA